MRRWFREWLLIDVLALGLGVALLVGYIVSYDRISPDSPEGSLIPNLATEVLGVWVSVRVIDRIIRAREAFHSSRRNMVTDLASVKGILDNLFPRPTTTDLSTLRTWKKWITDRTTSRYRHFSTDERATSDQLVVILNEVIDTCGAYLEQNYQVNETLDALKKQVIACVEPRKNVRKVIDTYLYKYGTKVLFETVDLSEVASLLRAVVSESEAFLSPQELAVFQSAARRMDGISANNHDEVIQLNLNLRSLPEELFWAQFAWYRALDEAHTNIVERPYDEIERWMQLLVMAEARLEEDDEQYPALILQAGKRHVTAVSKLAPLALNLHELSLQFEQRLEELRRNVAVETEEE